MIWFLPLEQLNERYTEQMYRWVTEGFNRRGVRFIEIFGEPLVRETEGDQFLNWASRVYFTSKQNGLIAELFHAGSVEDGDTFFVADIWHPGIESIPYLADAMGIKVKIFGINYAGPFDPTDLTHKMIRWGRWFERMIYYSFTGVFVGSEFHKRLIRGNVPRLSEESCPIHVTGLVWDEEDAVKGIEPLPTEEQIVLWPHRISSDKNPERFFHVARTLSREFPNVRWVITSSRMKQEFVPDPPVEFITLNKRGYYRMLAGSSLMLSTAYHENFGYTVREATALGVPILCPIRACYPEMIETGANLYDDYDLVGKVRDHLSGDFPIPVATLKQFGGIDQMIDIMTGGSDV